MGVSIQDRTDFLNMLDACRTEQQLFSRLTFAVMFHQTDPAAREDLLDDVRGAACNMQLPAVNYKIDQWLNTCKQAWQADPAAFMAAVNADAKQRKLALEGSAAQPGLLADVPMQSVAWLVPQLLPLGEVSLLGAAVAQLLHGSHVLFKITPLAVDLGLLLGDLAFLGGDFLLGLANVVLHSSDLGAQHTDLRLNDAHALL